MDSDSLIDADTLKALALTGVLRDVIAEPVPAQPSRFQVAVWLGSSRKLVRMHDAARPRQFTSASAVVAYAKRHGVAAMRFDLTHWTPPP
jgi:hypothetical protein